MAPRPPTRPTPALVPAGAELVEPELVEPDAAISTSRGITIAAKQAIEGIERGAELARKVRDAIDEETPSDTPIVEATATTTTATVAVKKPKAKRPGWAAVIGMCVASTLAGSPIWDAVTGGGHASATKIGQLEGKLGALESRLNSLDAAALRGASERAVEFRELDAKIVALGGNVELVMAKLGVPEEQRKPIPQTSEATESRHEQAIRDWEHAIREAERRQIEQAIADSGTVTGK